VNCPKCQRITLRGEDMTGKLGFYCPACQGFTPEVLKPEKGTQRQQQALPKVGSSGERTFETYWSILAQDLPEPIAEYRVPEDERNRKSKPSGYRVDWCWPDARLILECQGQVHSIKEQLARDCIRHNRLVLWDYTVLFATSRQIKDNPEQVIAFVREALERRTTKWNTQL